MTFLLMGGVLVLAAGWLAALSVVQYRRATIGSLGRARWSPKLAIVAFAAGIAALHFGNAIPDYGLYVFIAGGGALAWAGWFLQICAVRRIALSLEAASLTLRDRRPKER
jgi:hypothetical protein